MKKKIALLLAAVMVVGSLPMTAFASTTNTVSKIQTVEDGDDITTAITIDEFKGVIAGEEKQTIKLTLTNAKFRDAQEKGNIDAIDTDREDLATAKQNLSNAFKDCEDAEDVTAIKYDGVEVTSVEALIAAIKADGSYTAAGADATVDGADSGSTEDALQAAVDAWKTANDEYEAAVAGSSVEYTKISDTEYMAEFYATNDDTVVLDILAEADGSGDATVTLEARDSVVSSQTLKIATIAGGATTATIGGTVSIEEGGTAIKSIVITETTAGSLDEDPVIKLKLSNGFTWSEIANDDVDKATKVVPFPAGQFTMTADNILTGENGALNGTNLVVGGTNTNNNGFVIDDDDKSVAYITLTGVAGNGKSTKATTISLQNVRVAYDDDDVEVGDECEVTISGSGATKQTLTVGTAADYGVSFTVEDKDLPVFYAGTYDEDVETLTVTIKEGIENSWVEGRKAQIVFPEGVEIIDVDANSNADSNTNNLNAVAVVGNADDNEFTLTDLNIEADKKAEVELTFMLSVAPDFTGDITATLTGAAVGDDQEVVVGTAVAPVTVEADVNELKIDYRNTEASDIVITEADAGVLKKGTTVALQLENIGFDGDPTVEVESGDMKIENVDIDGGVITFDIKTESQKEAAVIRISDVQLYMQRSLPAGEYDLNLVAGYAGNDSQTANVDLTVDDTLADNAIFRNYHDPDGQGTYDVDEIEAVKGYVTVVTAGRDQGDETFTTTVAVTIGADKMYAGTKEIALDVPAYISNGYTMMPVRAVTEALSGSAIVRWDDPTKTVTITFGQRVISMTVGSNVMKINGVDVAMQAQCEITDSRAFIPLRDLGYALGLNDSKIAWDDATKTAKLN